MAAATGSIQVLDVGGAFDSATNPQFTINDGTNSFTFVIDNDARSVNTSATQLADDYAGLLHVPTLDESDGETKAYIAVSLSKMGLWWEGNSGNSAPTVTLTDAVGQVLNLTWAQPGTTPSGTRIAGNAGTSKNNIFRTDANNYIMHNRNSTDSVATHNLLFYWAIKYAYANDGLAIRPYIVTNSSGGTAEPAVNGSSSGYYSIKLESTTGGFLGNVCKVTASGTVAASYLQTSGGDGSGGTIGYFYEAHADSGQYSKSPGYLAQIYGVSGGVYFKNGTIAGSGSDAALSAANIAEAIKVMVDSDLIGVSASRSTATVSLTNDTDGSGGNQTITKNSAAASLLTLSGMSGGGSSSGMASNRLSEYGNYIVMERVSGSKSPTTGKEGEQVVPSDAGTVSFANAGFMFYSGSSEATSRFYSVKGSGSVASEIVHQLDTFTGSLVVPGSEKIEFNGAGSGEQLFSSTGGQMDLDADTLIELTAPTIELAGATKVDIQSDAIHFGENGNTDVVLTFNGDNADGVLKWMEDEDYFEFSDDVFMASGEKIQFGDAGEYISGDGTDLTIASSGDGTIDVAGAIILDADGGSMILKDAGTEIGRLQKVGSNLVISSSVSDGDLVFGGNDGGSKLTALTLDMSEGGKASFASTVTAVGSFIIGSADMSEADLEKLDGITNGTAAASKAIVLDANKSITGVTAITASAIQVDRLDVNILNSITKTSSTLEIEDKLIIAASGSDSASSADGGLQIGGTHGSDTVASVLYNHSLTGLNFNIGGSSEVLLTAAAMSPATSGGNALGTTGLQWSDLFLEEGAVINFDNGDVTMTQTGDLLVIAGGNTRVDRLELDSASDYIDVDTDLKIVSAADVVIDPVGGDLRVDGNVVPNSDSADSLGASGTAWANLYVDAIDLAGQGSISMGGTGRIDLDADDDTSIRAIADDVIAFEIGGTDRLLLSASNMAPLHSDGYALGDVGNHWSDLFLASGAVVNFNAGDVTMTHASNLMTIAGGNTRVDRLEIDGASDYIDVDTDLKIISAVDIVLDPVGGDVKVDGNVVPNADDGGTLGSANLNWSDLYIADEGVLNFGDDQDVTLTHVLDTGLLLSSTDQLQFGDSGTYIYQSADAALDVVSDGSVNVTAGAAGLVLKGTTPKLTIGDAGAEDTFLVFDGNAQDYRMGLDDGTDKLELGVGAAHGSTIAFTVDSSAVTSFIGSGGSGEGMVYTPADNTMTMVDSSGTTFVTVGGDASSEFAIDVSQATSNSGKIRATAFVTYSDENLKTNVNPMNDAMGTVMQLQGVTFDWKNSGDSDFGFIAQEIQKVIPQAVSDTTDNGVMGVDYSRLTAVLVEAMKSQQSEIETLKGAIAKLSK